MSSSSVPNHRPAGALTSILQRAGVVTEQQIDTVLARHRETGVRSGDLLVQLGMATEEDIGWALARQLDLTFVDPRPETFDRELVAMFPEELLRRHDALPLVLEDDCLAVALADPTDAAIIDELTVAAGRPLRLSVATPSAIRRALREVYGLMSHDRHSHERIVSAQLHVPRHHALGAAFLLERLREASAAGAAELHLLPRRDTLEVMHRVSGRMVAAGAHARDALADVLAWLESLDGPALLPDQPHASGRVLCPAGGSVVELAVSMLRQPNGVCVTIEPLGPAFEPRLDKLGVDPTEYALLREAIAADAGLGLVIGPPGCGASTTLEAIARELEQDARRCVRWRAGTYTDMRLGHSAAEGMMTALVHGADVAALDDVPVSAVGDALAPAGAGRWTLARVAADDTFALLEQAAATPTLRATLASRLRFVVRQRRAWRRREAAPGATGAPRRCIVFETLIVDDGLREALRTGQPGEVLLARAIASGFIPLHRRLDVLVGAGLISTAEAARLAA